MTLPRQVKQTIKTHSLLRRDGKVIVAVSGGADSLALLVILTELGYDCVAAHCNFHLRGEESDRDMRHVEQVTAALGVDLYVKDFDIAARRALTGESLEMACREVRYKWFFELLDRDSAQAIAVGHHREDQVETFFLNLLRGSSLTGLAGMRHRNKHVVRPLLDSSRADIEAYLNDKGIAWVDDSTNSTDAFARNRLRLSVLPMLESQFPGAADAILRSMAILRENESVYRRGAERDIAPFRGPAEGEFRLAEMAETDPLAPVLLFEALRSEGFSRTQTDDMLQSALRSGGTFIAPGSGHTRRVDHGILRAPHACVTSEPGATEVSLLRDIFEPVRIEVSRHHVSEFSPERDPNVAYIDERALEGAPRWTIRPWKRGDRMTPYGMNGTKLLSDIFADARLSALRKQQAMMLTRDDRIVWAIGIRASALYSIGPETRYYIRLRFIPA